MTPAHASLPVPTSDIERRVLGDIARHGWHVVLVRRGTHDHEGRGPLSDHPAAQHAHAYLNVVGEMVQEGQSLASGDTTDELLEGFSVRFGAVADTPRLHLLTWATGSCSVSPSVRSSSCFRTPPAGGLTTRITTPSRNPCLPRMVGRA